MTRMNAGIILSGQAPDIAGSVAKGIQNAGMYNEVKDRNALRDLYADQGASILAGDQNALNMLAQHNPQAAMDMRTAQGQESRAAKEFEMKMEEYARSLDAAERTRQAAAIEQGLAKASSLYQAGDLRGVNMMLSEVGQNPIRDLSEFPAIAAQYEKAWTVLDRMKEFNAPPKPADEYGRYAAEETAAGRKPLTRIEYAQAKRGNGTVVYDPTTGNPLVSIGGVAPPAGQDPTTTATPRDSGKLSQELSKADAAVIKDEREKATAAETLMGVADQIEVLAPEVGYSGPGGKVYGVADDILFGLLPGDSGARGAFEAVSMEAQLSFTEKTKGAITDREMGMFKAAVPGLGKREDANIFMAKVMRAGAKRVATRANFMEAWAGKRGSLQGAAEAWQAYMEENPLLEKGEGGLVVNEEGDWRSYIGRESTIDATPASIGQMSYDQLMSLDVNTMTSQQLDAVEARLNEVRP